MLTLEQKNANEIKYIEMLSRLNIDLTAINEYLREIKFFDAPYSAQHLGAYPGGLCEHAIRLANELMMLCNAYYPNRYTVEDVLKVALFKDIYRAVMLEGYQKNVKDENTGNWVCMPAYRTASVENRSVFGDIPFSSYMIAKDYIQFTNEQIEAIVWSSPSDWSIDVHDVLRKYPLAVLTRMAETVASYIGG